MRTHHLRVGVELHVRLSTQGPRGCRRAAGHHEQVRTLQLDDCVCIPANVHCCTYTARLVPALICTFLQLQSTAMRCYAPDSAPLHLIPDLKPSFYANPPNRSLPFFFGTDSTDSPDCLLLLLSISVCYFFCFFLFLHFLVVGYVR